MVAFRSQLAIITVFQLIDHALRWNRFCGTWQRQKRGVCLFSCMACKYLQKNVRSPTAFCDPSAPCDEIGLVKQASTNGILVKTHCFAYDVRWKGCISIQNHKSVIPHIAFAFCCCWCYCSVEKHLCDKIRLDTNEALSDILVKRSIAHIT